MTLKPVKPAACIGAIAAALFFQGCQSTPDKVDEPAKEPVEIPPAEVAPEPLPPAEQAPAKPETTVYTVKSGDTLSAIAAAYGLRLPDILALNPSVKPDRIYVGQKIQLPGKVDIKAAPKAAPAAKPAADGKTTVYVVKGGDSLSVIAKRVGCKVSCIKELNGLKSDKIWVGQKLKVPAGAKVAAKPVLTKPSAARPVAAKPEAAVKPAPKAAVTAPKDAEPAASVAEPAPAAPAAVAEPEVAAPPAVSGEAKAPATSSYTVRAGDDLYSIAMRWAVSPNEIKALNGLEGDVDKITLKPGQVLKIPAVD